MVLSTTVYQPSSTDRIKEKADLGTLISLPFKLVIWAAKKIVIGIPIMIGKSILMALVMALLPLIVVAAAIYWFFTTQI